MSPKRLIIIGGSDAGVSAALRARELVPERDRLEVVMLVADDYPNYSICGLPFLLSGEVPEPSRLAHRTRGEIEAAGVTVRPRHTAISLDAAARTVLLQDDGGHELSLDYDVCVLATGALSKAPPIAGQELEGVFHMRFMDDALLIRRFLETRQPRTALIVGSGYIGLEMADAFTRRGVRTTLAGRAPSVLKTVDDALGAMVAEELARHGVTVFSGVEAASLQPEGDGLLLLGKGVEARGDMALIATGAQPNTALAEAAGVTLAHAHGGAIAVSRTMATNLPGVFAAGDCVTTWRRLVERDGYLPLGTTAHKQGRVAGANAVMALGFGGGETRFAGSLGTQVVQIFDLIVARTGLRPVEATQAGFQPRTVDFTCDDHKAYYPGATPLRILLTGDAVSGRLLGVQLAGRRGAEVAKRVDIAAAALHHGMGVADLLDYDLSYTPPLSSPWDPVQMAAQAWLTM